MVTQQSIRSDLLLVLVTLLAAISWVFSREALNGMEPLFFIGVRFLGAGLLLAIPGWSRLRKFSPQAWRRALLTGCVMGIAMMFWIMGLFFADNMGVGAFLTSLAVVFIPIVGRLLFGEKAARSTWVAMGIALIGLVFLRIEGGFSLSTSDLFFLASALLFSLHFNLNSRFAAKLPVWPLTAIQLSVTGIIGLLGSLAFESAPNVPSQSLLGWLVASILIGTCMRFFIQVKAQGMAPVSHAAVIMTLEPVWASILGVYWFAESMTGIQLLGCCLIFSALLVSRWRLLLGRPAS